MPDARAIRRKSDNYNFAFSENAIYGLLGRIFGPVLTEGFIVRKKANQDGIDSYRIYDAEASGKNVIILEATSGVAAAAAIRWYLQEKCGCYIGPITSRMAQVTELPRVGAVVENESPYMYRYFFNYCTYGYSCAFWDWNDWEHFIDWLLLSGYNLILNPIGNESVWLNLLQKLGYSHEGARKFLCSPVFYPWQCMMNLCGWGGAAPEHWYLERVELSNKINRRLAEFGVRVVLPGYAGMIPNDFQRYYPNAKIHQQGTWCGFERPALLPCTDSMFDKVSSMYYEQTEELFGKCTAYFSVDPFHEGGNSNGVDFAEFGRRCYEHMRCAHPNAVWVLQGWGSNPSRKLLRSLPAENLLIVNLKSEENADGGDDFSGRPWLYGAVNNFGGRRVLRANLTSQYEGPQIALRHGGAMAGIGLMPEGIELDECAFDTFSDISFQKDPAPIEIWQRNYIKYRYGVDSASLYNAWTIMRCNVYCSDTTATPRESPFCTRPSLTVSMITPAAQSDVYTYDPRVLVEVAKAFWKEEARLQNCMPYRFDFAEILRQLIDLTAWGVVKELQTDYLCADYAQFERVVSTFFKLGDYQTKVMTDSPARSLEDYLKQARRFGHNEAEQTYFSSQLKRLITSWGDHAASQILHDYSAREWRGMLENFYLPRWKKYVAHLQANIGSQAEQIDSSFPQCEIEDAFCEKDTDMSVYAAAENFAYVPELLAYCEKLLGSQEISVCAKKQEHVMELG